MNHTHPIDTGIGARGCEACVGKNPTSMTGTVVHRPNRSGFPLCGRFVRHIHYTEAEPNCPHCLSA